MLVDVIVLSVSTPVYLACSCCFGEKLGDPQVDIEDDAQTETKVRWRLDGHELYAMSFWRASLN